MRISLKKTIALVIALVKLHNYCLDEKDSDVPTLRAIGEVRTELQGGVPLETIPTSTGRTMLLPRQLIDGGYHFDDLDQASRRSRTRQYQSQAVA